MGGDLPAKAANKAPGFMVYTLRDSIGANLDRIQIVKAWIDCQADTHEKVYDVAWAGDRKPGKGDKLPAVGSTVDVKNANWTNTIGASDLTEFDDSSVRARFRPEARRVLLRPHTGNPRSALA